MFESLSNRLGGVFDRMRGRGALREDDVNEAMREIRVALLEADVALPVVRSFIEKVKAEAIGQEVVKSVRPDQQVVKIVHDAIVELLGGQEAPAVAARVKEDVIMFKELRAAKKAAAKVQHMDAAAEE